MSKGNLILGTGAGSIGDVTLMRRNGAEVARVRIRKIKNPKSQGQAEQRMYMAPVMKFYSPLSKVLETSFEGLNRADSYAKFLSINSNLARANQWAVKKGSGFVPLPYQISQGTIIAPEVNSVGKLILGINAAATTLGALSTAILAKYPSLQNGDQVTYIYSKHNADEKWAVAYNRFFINTESTDGLPANLFVIAETDTPTLLTASFTDGDNPAPAQAFMFSRWDGEKWARSTSFMVMDGEYLANYDGGDAEIMAPAIASYMKGAGQVPVSDVYLNGSDD